MKLAFTSEFV